MDVRWKLRGKWIYGVLHYRGKAPFVFTTGVQTYPKAWDMQQQRVRKKDALYSEKNSALAGMAKRLQTILLHLKTEGIACNNTVLRQRWRAATQQQQGDLCAYWSQLIAARGASPDYAAGTVDNYRSSLHLIEKYLHSTGTRAQQMQECGLNFHRGLCAWMHGEGYSKGYMQAVVAHVKNVLAVACEEGLHDNPAFRSRRFSVKQEPDRIKVYLNDAEVDRLRRYTPVSEAERVVWAAHLVQCYTGVRFGDVQQVQGNLIRVQQGVETITIRTGKTKRVVTLPVEPDLRALLRQYPDGIPVRSNKTHNRRLRQICATAGIEQAAQITTHTGRRSFATNKYLYCLRTGRSFAPVMQVMGSRSEAVFFKHYIAVDATGGALALARGA